MDEHCHLSDALVDVAEDFRSGEADHSPTRKFDISLAFGVVGALPLGLVVFVPIKLYDKLVFGNGEVYPIGTDFKLAD